jgi:hypothetical protein
VAGKRFVLTERFQTEFRVEAFNVTNTPPLGNPNGAFGTAAFGTIATALDPRAAILRTNNSDVPRNS